MKENNPFKNINVNKAKIAMQQRDSDGIVVKKKRGRPASPNMSNFSLWMDKSLYAQLTKEAKDKGVSRSFIIAQALRIYLATNKLM